MIHRMTPLRTVPPCCVVSLGLGVGQRTGTCTGGRGDDGSGRSYCTTLHLDAAESRFQVESECQWPRMDPESSSSSIESSGTRTNLECTNIQYHINSSFFRKVGVIESQTQRKTEHRCSSTTTRVQRNVHWSDGYGSSSASNDTICLRSESQRSGIGFNLRPEQDNLDDIDIDGVEVEFEEKTSVPEAPARIWNIQDIVQTIRYLISNSLVPLPPPLLKTSSSSSGFIVRLKSVTTSLTSTLINFLFEKFPSRARSTVTTARRSSKKAEFFWLSANSFRIPIGGVLEFRHPFRRPAFCGLEGKSTTVIPASSHINDNHPPQKKIGKPTVPVQNPVAWNHRNVYGTPLRSL
ncbi:hypothetical protein K435DRAFT_789067 [Dendrothele bispora CBS 962.96]|uniref:Uncharacterized protein n=1 Tax=Dendrothele bispora (strain CBS 962.96) TaxID=1314807 RepID=A0A4V4HIK9_DENBC|nr:hypothetical protein K435DRAFT_789067 [Dendrothele bispora CBS 962.96]